MNDWENKSFLERIKSLSKQEIAILIASSVLLATFFTINAHFAKQSAINQTKTIKQQEQKREAERNKLLGKIDKLEKELQEVREPIQEKKDKVSAKELKETPAK